MVHSHLWEELQVKEMLNYGSDNLLGTGHMSTLGSLRADLAALAAVADLMQEDCSEGGPDLESPLAAALAQTARGLQTARRGLRPSRASSDSAASAGPTRAGG